MKSRLAWVLVLALLLSTLCGMTAIAEEKTVITIWGIDPTGVGDGNGGSGTGDSQGGQDQGAGKTDRPSIPRTADGSPLLPAALLAAGGAALCGMGALAARRGRSS